MLLGLFHLVGFDYFEILELGLLILELEDRKQKIEYIVYCRIVAWLRFDIYFFSLLARLGYCKFIWTCLGVF